MLGMRAESRMSVKRNLSMIPLKMQILLLSLLLISAHTCTLIGCLGLGLGLGAALVSYSNTSCGSLAGQYIHRSTKHAQSHPDTGELIPTSSAC